jgi:hypothetical protein
MPIACGGCPASKYEGHCQRSPRADVAGASIDAVLVYYPSLGREDVLATLEYTTADAQERER